MIFFLWVTLTFLYNLTQCILNFNLNIFLTYCSFSTILVERCSQSIKVFQIRVIISKLFISRLTWCILLVIWWLFHFTLFVILLCGWFHICSLIGSEHLFVEVRESIVWVASINMFKFWNVDGLILSAHLSTIKMAALLRINHRCLVLILIRIRIHDVNERFAFHIKKI